MLVLQVGRNTHRTSLRWLHRFWMCCSHIWQGPSSSYCTEHSWPHQEEGLSSVFQQGPFPSSFKYFIGKVMCYSELFSWSLSHHLFVLGSCVNCTNFTKCEQKCVLVSRMQDSICSASSCFSTESPFLSKISGYSLQKVSFQKDVILAVNSLSFNFTPLLSLDVNWLMHCRMVEIFISGRLWGLSWISHAPIKPLLDFFSQSQCALYGAED